MKMAPKTLLTTDEIEQKLTARERQNLRIKAVVDCGTVPDSVEDYYNTLCQKAIKKKEDDAYIAVNLSEEKRQDLRALADKAHPDSPDEAETYYYVLCKTVIEEKKGNVYQQYSGTFHAPVFTGPGVGDSHANMSVDAPTTPKTTNSKNPPSLASFNFDLEGRQPREETPENEAVESIGADAESKEKGLTERQPSDEESKQSAVESPDVQDSTTDDEVSLASSANKAKTRRICESLSRSRLYEVDWSEEDSYAQPRSNIPNAIVRKGVFRDPTEITDACLAIEDDQHCAIHTINHMERTIMDVAPVRIHGRLSLFDKIQILHEHGLNRHVKASMELLANVRNNHFGHKDNNVFHDASTTKEKFLAEYHFVLCGLQDFYMRELIKFDMRKLEDEYQKALRKNDDLSTENESLKRNIERLEREIENLRGEIQRLGNATATRARAQSTFPQPRNYRSPPHSRPFGAASPQGRGRGYMSSSGTSESGNTPNSKKRNRRQSTKGPNKKTRGGNDSST